ncbi:Pimeloyl-ACP methyl ester carboxylesterase [Micromonospora sediminicola]|uniref:Pimeloyl-ACP methyl ester carboxylesterase n=1 Tax=Micromonospora sediminicola TaxID=946078 RepID=A0A1A9B981_9ACTN|nr:alpha/beta hydrolase [Micromonospora sediminicola]SBT65698.1 Pimeloyl-ACP methyl ester carboxylesterase [Micromonospora sediminicola]
MTAEIQHSPTTAEPGRAELAALVDAIRQLEGLTGQVGPFALPADTCDRAPELVAAVCRALDVPLTFDAPAGERDRDFAVAALAAEIRRAQRAPGLTDGRGDPAASAAEARRIRDEEDAGFRLHRVRRPDGTVLAVWDAGPLDAPPILVSPACAMSYRLSLPWVRALRGSYRCLVPQTRGTSERIDDPQAFDRRGYDIHAQADDLVALIAEVASAPVHLMGLCGGAVPALIAAGRCADRVSSLSLWHADLELGPDAEKTDHQVNLRALLDLAGESRDTAAWMRDKLTSGPMTGVPAGAGPLVVRPYATAELFYRYAKLTAATMHWDSRQTAGGVPQPSLIVTSRDDHTAHPSGSRRLAEILPDARLVVADHGTHLDAFRATPEQVSCLTSFLASLPAGG